MQLNKDKIATNFSSAAASYDQYSVMQQQAVQSIARRLNGLKDDVLPGPVLEIGCGTGVLSRKLATMLPGRRLTLVDLAPGMIDQNRQALVNILPEPHLVDWQVMDAETIDIRSHYALIASSLTLQWFQDPARSVTRLCGALIPGGFLLCSYLGDHSFPEWRQACRTLGLPCTINPMPNGETIMETVRTIGCEARGWEEMIQVSYPTAHDFFRSLKKTGTSTGSTNVRLNPRQMARLLSALQGQRADMVTVTYQINTILVRA